MSNQTQMQGFGLALAVATAFGCVAYERLVKNFSYPFVALFVATSYIPPFLVALYLKPGSLSEEASKLTSHRWSLLVYYLSGITSVLWYVVTRKQGVVVGALFEVKYIVVLALFYICFGDGRLSWNVVAGVALAGASIYLISKPT
jgi:drug/metabolite transporter (DMT)-like permease